LSIWVLTGVACGAAEAPGPALVSLVEAERAFARTCAAEGIRPAFLENLAEGSIVFRPGPVDARRWYADRPAPPGLLGWEPRFAEISRDGRFGYTTGPWEYRREAGQADPDSVGHYVSVWRKPSAGPWQVLIDVGTTYPPGNGQPGQPSFFEPRGARQRPRSSDAATTKISLLDADRRFGEQCLAEGTRAAYLANATEEIRFYRQGSPPISGRQAVDDALRGSSGALVTEPLAAEVSASADLGFTYGKSELRSNNASDGAVEAGHYLRIWRRPPSGEWKLALDVVLPAGPSPG
jgi:ketosteroid isomerase-like protein